MGRKTSKVTLSSALCSTTSFFTSLSVGFWGSRVIANVTLCFKNLICWQWWERDGVGAYLPVAAVIFMITTRGVMLNSTWPSALITSPIWLTGILPSPRWSYSRNASWRVSRKCHCSLINQQILAVWFEKSFRKEKQIRVVLERNCYSGFLVSSPGTRQFGLRWIVEPSLSLSKCLKVSAMFLNPQYCQAWETVVEYCGWANKSTDRGKWEIQRLQL